MRGSTNGSPFSGCLGGLELQAKAEAVLYGSTKGANALNKWQAHLVAGIGDLVAGALAYYSWSEIGPILSLDAPTVAELEFGSLTSMLNIGLFLPYMHAVGAYEAFKLDKRWPAIWSVLHLSVIPMALAIVAGSIALHYTVRDHLLGLGYESCDAREFQGRFGSLQVYVLAPVPEECRE